ncbi:hypothetical protein FE773_06960 [Caminibacter mediatlanticus TB-2]|uniref:Amino acid permease n=1 Tax=Caminibacter mediatlanticus TB-2 TaxID=391592 RepID=A0ABX5VCL7_9BACT|nr:hypothetical protein [Caminibacter mediatlanticus]QCT94935.1 hypothetical protein FE773_06960 [Caminibacter mediatlanticus TB-2]
MIENIIAIISTLFFSIILFHDKIDNSPLWRATAIPLASIIGSGFLVVAPLLYFEVGSYSPFAMAFLVILAYMIGSAIRYNILEVEDRLKNNSLNKISLTFERLSDIALAFAYVVSVTYYLSLFGDFSLRGIHIVNETLSKIIATSLIIFIAFYGAHRKFNFLAKFESLKLAIILGFLVTLIFGNIKAYYEGIWHLPEYKNFSTHSLMVVLGMLIVVQGFETSRYLGDKFDKVLRVKSMKLAQIISGSIYITYIFLMLYFFAKYPLPKQGLDSAIITFSKHIATILPLLLLSLSLIAQFDAAVADAQGGNGLFKELIEKYIPKFKFKDIGYIIIATFGLFIIWTSNIYEIITYASKAFAIYYFLQTMVASFTALKHNKDYLKFIYFSFVGSIALSVVIFGVPASG